MPENYYAKAFILQEPNYTDIAIHNVGEEKCVPSHSHGPAVRRHYLLHYIIEGEGMFEENKNIHHVKKGQAFLIYPELVTFYQADAKRPWHYVWIEFSGIKAEEYLRKSGLAKKSPIFKPMHEEDFAGEYLLDIIKEPDNAIRSVGLAHLFFDSLIKKSADKKESDQLDYGADSKELYVKTAIHYIAIHYWKMIKVQELAAICNLDRSYFCRIFKEKTGLSPQEFIVKFKVERACELLPRRELTIGDVARSVGYSDQLAFSKIFKKITGKSPTLYRL